MQKIQLIINEYSYQIFANATKQIVYESMNTFLQL